MNQTIRTGLLTMLVAAFAASCSANAAPCDSDSDCAAGEACISGGGVLFGGKACAVVEVVGGLDAGGDQDAAAEDAGPADMAAPRDTGGPDDGGPDGDGGGSDDMGAPSDMADQGSAGDMGPDAGDVGPDAGSDDLDGDGIPNDVDNCPMVSNVGQTDSDQDGQGDRCDDDDDNDTVLDADDVDRTDPLQCIDDDGDGCDDCSQGTRDVSDDGPDLDGDGLCDNGDTDDDDDGVDDASDNCPLVANANQADTDMDGTGDACEADADGDGVDDAADNCPMVDNPQQEDIDGDGDGDACDPDIDNDGVPNASDPDDFDPGECGDSDGDDCDDCSVGTDGFGPLTDADPTKDGQDTDGDNACDLGDDDDDNDGVSDGADPAPFDPTICGDSDRDTCDDCSIGVDGFGPLADADPANDGADSDNDGYCDAGENVVAQPDECLVDANCVATGTTSDAAVLAGEPNLTESRTYILSIAVANPGLGPDVDIVSVSGHGLNWTAELKVCSGENNALLFVYSASGTASASSDISVRFSANVNAFVVSYTKYKNVSGVTSAYIDSTGVCPSTVVDNRYAVQTGFESDPVVYFTSVAFGGGDEHSPSSMYDELFEGAVPLVGTPTIQFIRLATTNRRRYTPGISNPTGSVGSTYIAAGTLVMEEQ